MSKQIIGSPEKHALILRSGTSTNWLEWAEDTGRDATESFGEVAQLFKTGKAYTRIVPTMAAVPSATPAEEKIMRRELLKQFQHDIQKDASKQLPMFAFTVNRISKESLVLLKARTGYEAADLIGNNQWLLDNLKAIHETSSTGTTSKNTLRRLQKEFDYIAQDKLSLAEFKSEYQRKELTLLSHGGTIKTGEDRALHFLDALSNSHFKSWKEMLETREAIGFDEYPKTLDAVYLAAQAIMENKKTLAEPIHNRVMLTDDKSKRPPSDEPNGSPN